MVAERHIEDAALFIAVDSQISKYYPIFIYTFENSICAIYSLWNNIWTASPGNSCKKKIKKSNIQLSLVLSGSIPVSFHSYWHFQEGMQDMLSHWGILLFLPKFFHPKMVCPRGTSNCSFTNASNSVLQLFSRSHYFPDHFHQTLFLDTQSLK